MVDGDGTRPLSTDPVPGSVVILLPQLTFVEEATTRQELWSSPIVRKFGLFVDITHSNRSQGMHEYRVTFSSWSQMAIFCPAHFQSCNIDQLASSPLQYGPYGLAGWEGYRLVLQEYRTCYSVWHSCLPLCPRGNEKERNRQVRSSSD